MKIRGCFKKTWWLLNLRALKVSHINKISIFQCIGKIFCMVFQREPVDGGKMERTRDRLSEAWLGWNDVYGKWPDIWYLSRWIFWANIKTCFYLSFPILRWHFCKRKKNHIHPTLLIHVPWSMMARRYKDPDLYSLRRDRLSGKGILIMHLRGSSDHLTFIMGIPISHDRLILI